MNKKQTKILKIFSLITLSAGAIGGTSAALISCNNNKETPNNETQFAIKTAIIDSTGTKITLTYNGNIPSDFANNLKVKKDDKILDKNAWHISSDNLTITLKTPATKDSKLYILYNDQTIYANTDKISESVALLITTGTRVSLNNVDDINKLYVNTKLELPNGLQRKDISVIVVYDATVASAFALTANATDQDNDNWGNLKTIDLSRSNATSIGQVIHDDSEFNGNIIFPTNLTTINNYFLSNCSAFNQPLTLPNSITSIGGDFLSYCYVFNQSLTLPNSITSIGNSFLYTCNRFNQPLTLPNSITSIGNDFLYQCSAFNQPLTLSNSITSIGKDFLAGCINFNQPLTLPNSITSISDNFLQNCQKFNQPLTLPNSITSIGIAFLSNCFAFNNNNTVFDLSNLNSNIVISEYFLSQTILQNINIGSLSADAFVASSDSFIWPGWMTLQNLYVKGDHASDLVGKFPPNFQRNLVVKQ